MLVVVLIATRVVANTNAVVDPAFNVGAAPDADVLALAIQSDGRILVGGEFSRFSGAARNRITRLLPDGSPDPAFTPGTGADGDVFAIALQNDGRILLGGSFLSFSGNPRKSVVRLNANGSVDTNFVPADLNGDVRAVAALPDGKILVAGRFTTAAGQGRGRIARLNANGSLDTGFDPGTGADNHVRCLALQPDGKILIGGHFTMFNGVERSRIVRLETNGAVDLNFDPGSGADDQVRSIALAPDGKIFIGGDFEIFNGTNRSAVARLLTNGALDLSFDQGDPDNDTVRALLADADGSVWMGGDFQTAGGQPRALLARLQNNGVADPAANFVFDDPWDSMFALGRQRDGLVLAAGEFKTVDGLTNQRIVRIIPPAQPSTLRFGKPLAPSAPEATNATLLIERIGDTNGAASATVVTFSGSAIGGTDFVAIETDLVFAPGETGRVVSVALLSDLVFETNESFRVVITNANNAIRGVPFDIDVTIVEASPRIEFTGFGSNVWEGSTTCVLLRRTGYIWPEPWSVDYQIVPETARPDEDFSGPLRGTIDFTIGNDFRCIEIPTIQDGAIETNETFRLRLLSAVGAVVDTNATLSATILDEDYPVQLVTEVLTREAQGAVTLDVKRGDTGTNTVTVDYVLRNGTATSGEDFAAASGTLSFARGETVKTVMVSIMDDCRIEADEALFLALTNPTGGAVLGTNSATRVVIQDDERPGSFDWSFQRSVWQSLGWEFSAIVQPDDGILIGIQSPYGTVARLSPNGVLDSAFVATNIVPWPHTWDAYSTIVHLGPTQPDGRILVFGELSSYYQPGTNRLVRLLPDGAIDPGFSIPPNVALASGPMALQPDGRIFISGTATLAGGEVLEGLLRVHPDGSLDTSFRPQIPSSVFALALQADGRILVGGLFQINGESFCGVVRLHSSGGLDASFAPVSTRSLVFTFDNNSPPVQISLETNGNILVAGSFNRVNGSILYGLVRVFPNGEVDFSFDNEVAGDVTSFTLQNGRIVLAGSLAWGLTGRDPVCRLLTNGQLDLSFQLNEEVPFTVPASVFATRAGKIIVAAPYSGLFRLHSDPVPQISFRGWNLGRARTGVRSVADYRYDLQTSADLRSWQTLDTTVSTSCETELMEPSASGDAVRFFRVVASPHR